MRVITVLALVLVLATSVYGFEKKAFQMREDFGTEPLYNCYLNYNYYIPCPTYSWFWSYTGWSANDMIGEFFTVGDPSMFTSTGCPPYTTCDPLMAHTIEQFRILDFAGYGTIYPGLFTVAFDIWCSMRKAARWALPFGTAGRLSSASVDGTTSMLTRICA